MQKLFVFLLVFIGTAHASVIVPFCSISRTPQFAHTMLSEHTHRLDFLNQGGLFNGGVCWWHARFTRNATYIANFAPNEPALNEEQTKELIKEIRKADRVVTIPGYTSLKDFSRVNEELIQRELESWQRYDGFIRQQWVVGLWGLRKLPAHKMKARMQHLYDYVQIKGSIAYLKLQLKGLPAHSWLVIGMSKRSDGFELRIIDSNYRSPISYRYRFGDKYFDSPGYGRFVPYLGKVKESRKIREIRKSFCQEVTTL